MRSLAMKHFVSLESGDHLSREEFEYRYAQCTHIKKAELVEGVVYVASPVRYEFHGLPHVQLATWLGVYQSATPGVFAADNVTVRLDAKNEVQPDLLLRWDEAQGGQSRISPDNYIEGAPELIAEIASSSAAYDLHDKKDVYCRCGVKEYLVWVATEKIFYWFCLENQVYVREMPDAQGIIKSRVFPGLWLNVPALLNGQLQTVLETLQVGLSNR